MPNNNIVERLQTIPGVSSVSDMGRKKICDAYLV